MRVLGGAQCALGAALLTRPDRVVRVVAGSGDTMPPRWLARLLGGRLLVQGAGSLAVPSPTVAALGAGTDGLHALSMVAVAALRPRYRRVALVNVVAAAASAAVSAAVAGVHRS